MPLPLAMMIPFMGIQSAVMAKQFGENFQYGKRRISAMSNDEFNKLTPKMIQDNANAELKAMIPSMQSSVTDMRGFQEFLVKEFILMVDQLIKAGLGSLLGLTEKGVTQAIADIEHFLHGHTDLHIGEPSTVEPVPEAPIQAPTTTPTIPIEEQEPPTETILTPQFTLLSLLKEAQGMVQLSDGKWKVFSQISGNWSVVFTAVNQADAIFRAKSTWPPVSYKQLKNNELGDDRWFWVINSKVSNLT